MESVQDQHGKIGQAPILTEVVRVSFGRLMVKGEEEEATDQGSDQHRIIRRQTRKEQHLLKKLHFIAAIEEGALELRN